MGNNNVFLTAKNIFGPEERIGRLFGNIDTVKQYNSSQLDEYLPNNAPLSKRTADNKKVMLEYIEFAKAYDTDPLVNEYSIMQLDHIAQYGNSNPNINVLGSDGFHYGAQSFDSVIEDTYFMYGFVSYGDQCGSVQDHLVVPNPYILSVLHKRFSTMSLPKRDDRKTHIQKRLDNSNQTLTDQDRALLVGALYALNQKPLVVSRKDSGLYPIGCDVWTGQTIPEIGLSFEYPTCRGNIFVDKQSQYSYFSIMASLDLITPEQLAKASQTGYFYQIYFSGIDSNGPMMWIENKDPNVNYGKFSVGASRYDYAVQKTNAGGVERKDGVRFFDACFMGSCGDNDLNVTLGVQKKIDAGDYGYVFMRFGKITENKLLHTRIPESIYPRFQSTQDYIVTYQNNNPRNGVDYADGYRGDLIENLNNKPSIDLTHIEVVNMMKRFHDSIKVQ